MGRHKTRMKVSTGQFGTEFQKIHMSVYDNWNWVCMMHSPTSISVIKQPY